MPSKQMDRHEQEKSTLSMVGYYRLGYEKRALDLAATLFEVLVNSKSETQSDNMDDKINSIETLDLHSDNLFKYTDIFLEYCDYKKVKTFDRSPNLRGGQVKQRLHNFRQFRNQLTHPDLEVTPAFIQSNIIEDWIIYLWSELAHDSFEKAHKKIGNGKSIFETLPKHQADYMVRAIEELKALEKDEIVGHADGKTEIKPKDFENLFDLREKLVLLKNYVSDWLKTEGSILQTDILTTIDTTSAYIWMPLVPQTFGGDDRRSVYDCSVSILATPLDLRIYMDFGGYVRDQRKFYYSFLDSSPEYEALVDELKDKAGIEVFDVDWYSFIFNRIRLPNWLDQRELALAKARSKINKISKPENSPITWNRCLHGYVISRYDLADDDVIDFAMIEPKLRDIITFYQAFNSYKDRIRVGRK